MLLTWTQETVKAKYAREFPKDNMWADPEREPPKSLPPYLPVPEPAILPQLSATVGADVITKKRGRRKARPTSEHLGVPLLQGAGRIRTGERSKVKTYQSHFSGTYVECPSWEPILRLTQAGLHPANMFLTDVLHAIHIPVRCPVLVKQQNASVNLIHIFMTNSRDLFSTVF